MAKTISVNGACYVVSQHGKERIYQRGISTDIIRRVILMGRVVESLSQLRYEFGKYRIIVDCKGSTLVIVTAMIIGGCYA